MEIINMSQFLLRIYGDSLSLPRHSEGVTYKKSWPELLKNGFHQKGSGTEVSLYNRSFSDATSERILQTYRSDSFYFGRPGGDIVIFQCGVVDCAPRPIPQRLRNIISKLPNVMRVPIVRFIHVRRALLQSCGFTWRIVKPDPFLNAITTTLKMMAEDFPRVYVINIAPTTSGIEEHSPGFSSSILMYNELIAQAVTTVAKRNITLLNVHEKICHLPDGVETAILKSDGHHLTLAGHKLYADAILEAEHNVDNVLHIR